MKKEFNLSYKIQDSSEFKGTWLWCSDVKEFIRLLKTEINYEMTDGDEKVSKETKSVLKVLKFKIDKLAGDKLI